MRFFVGSTISPDRCPRAFFRKIDRSFDEESAPKQGVREKVRLEHRAEKWVAVFGKKDAATRNYSIEPDSEIRFD
ncbi:hypothetical protein, partial [Labrys sp. WJW]|uniref:hypothetical protein n=1 Tax=Labrys sp. WJW TaxID=1737983 RepID=UPI001AEC9036